MMNIKIGAQELAILGEGEIKKAVREALDKAIDDLRAAHKDEAYKTLMRETQLKTGGEKYLVITIDLVTTPVG